MDEQAVDSGDGSSSSVTDADPDTSASTTGDTASTTAGTTAGTTADTNAETTTADPTDPDAEGTAEGTGESTTEGTTETTEETTGDVEPIACGSTCVSVPGDGWSAPVRLEIDNAEGPGPDCAGAWDMHVEALFSELVGPPAECGCSCGDPVDVSCSQTMTLNRKANNGVACGGAATLDSYPITPGCNAIDEGDLNTRWDLVVPNPQGGSCDPIDESVIEPASFATRYTLCGESAPAQGECNGDQQCVADSDVPLCVYAEGDLACPGEGFGVKHLVYTDEIVDDRSCSACSCGAPVGTCVTSGVDLYNSDTSCQPALFNPPPLDMPQAGCVISNFAVFDANYPASAVPEPQTSCTPSASAAAGGVTAPGVMTLCCNG